MTKPLTPQQVHILQHALGLDRDSKGKSYRNHYSSGPDCDSYATCTGLVELGLMGLARSPWTFVVTSAGKELVCQN